MKNSNGINSRENVSSSRSVSVPELFKSAQSALVKANEIGISIGRIIERGRAGVERFQASVAKLADTFAHGLSQIGKALAQLDELLIALELIHERYGVIMLAVGLPPVGELDPVQKQEIIAYYDAHTPEETRQYVENWLLDYFDADRLASVLATWEVRPWLAKRMPILRQVVEAHVAGNYFLSVPSILPQMEGLVADNFAVTKYMSQEQYKEYLKALLDSKSLLEYPDQIKDFMLDTVLVRFAHGAPIGSDLSRHAILHGADTSYGTAVNSLNTILLFHYIQDSFRLTATPTGQCYHLIGCSKLTTRSTKRVFFSTIIEAHQAGLRSCKHCLDKDRLAQASLMEAAFDPAVIARIRKRTKYNHINDG